MKPTIVSLVLALVAAPAQASLPQPPVAPLAGEIFVRYESAAEEVLGTITATATGHAPPAPLSLSLERPPSPALRVTAAALIKGSSPAAPARIPPLAVGIAQPSKVAAPSVIAPVPEKRGSAASKESGPAPLAEARSPGPRVKSWVATHGSTLKLTINEWASIEGWVVSWNDNRPDLEIVGTLQVPGSLVDAVTYLFGIYQASGAKYEVELYKEQKLILVKKQ